MKFLSCALLVLVVATAAVMADNDFLALVFFLNLSFFLFCSCFPPLNF